MRKTREQKGITLIALIITIVVLLILAVVAINSITNDGIISKAQSAADKYNQSVQNEADQLQNYLDYLNGPKTYAPYTVGQEVKLKDTSKEPGTFYVIEDSSETEDTVTIVTKLCINTDDPENIVQSSNPSKMAFAKTNDWDPLEVSMSYTDIYGTGEPSSNHYAAYAAYKYGEQFGSFGRLIKSGESNTIPLFVIPFVYYWTGTICEVDDSLGSGYIVGAQEEQTRSFDG